jgi:hypothetical protein
MQILCRAVSRKERGKHKSLWADGLARVLENVFGWPQNADGAVG